MATDWPLHGVDDLRRNTPDGLATGPFGSSVSAKFFQASGVPLIRGSNLSEQVGHRLIEDDYVYVSEEKAAEFSRAIARRGDLVFTCWGTIGQVGLVDKNSRFDRYLISNKQMKLSPDPAKADSLYLYYLFSSREVQTTIQSAAIGSSVPGFNLGQLRGLRLPVPGIETQRSIAAVLGALDDKIEHNRKTSRALEGLARAIFKAWFVDFEPVKAKVAGATSFPGMSSAAFAALPARFADSPLGLVPEGWNTALVGELASFVLGGDWGKDSATDETPSAACCIRGADIPDLWANGLGKMPIRFLKPGSLDKRSLRHGDIVVEISGGSPTQSTGRPVLVREAMLNELSYPLVCSNFCRIFRPRPVRSVYTYFLFRWMYDAEQFFQYENGTTGIKNFAFTKFCEVHSVVDPPDAILCSFEATVSPLLDRMAYGGTESRKLAELRDYLLPKLLTGEVRVRNKENAT